MPTQLGLFGKVPAHGDFIERNLPRSFTAAWDEWLQRGLASSREQLDQQWLSCYLTSPIWRFALSVGSVDSLAWAGILVPSVDSVGRYFPLTIASPIANNCNLFDFQQQNDDWYHHLEGVALHCLQQNGDADHAMAQLQQAPSPTDGLRATLTALGGGHAIAIADGQLHQAYAQLLSQLSTAPSCSQSLWWSNGSQQAAPTLLNAQGLPGAQQFTGFLNGRWQ